MEKRVFLAIALSILILLAYQSIMVKLYPPETQEDTEKPAPVQTISQPAEDLPEDLPELQPAVVKKVPPIQKKISTEKLELTISNQGGVISQAEIKDYKSILHEKELLGLEGYEDVAFTFGEVGDNSATLIYEDEEKRIVKRFIIDKTNYTIDLEINVQNKTDNSYRFSPNIYHGQIDLTELDNNPSLRRDKMFIELSYLLQTNVLRKNLSRISFKQDTSYVAQADWVGLRERYFCTVLKPSSAVKGILLQPIDKQAVRIKVISEDIVIPGQSQIEINALVYVGPQDRGLLAGINSFDKIVSFGRLDLIAQGVLGILSLVHRVIPNWGVAIIFLSLVISLILYPFTFKSLKSMQKMQAIQPQVEQLRKQYKDDPQKLNREIMKIYKEQGVNPFGGCLPMFLQIPIFFGLYQALMRSILLKGANFLWIKDLAEPDKLVVLEKPLPFIGNEINLLPVLMAITMVLQQKMSMKKSAASASMQQQQKMMMIFFPILLLYVLYHFPSGLTLYWTCYTCWTLIFQRKLAKASVS